MKKNFLVKFILDKTPSRIFIKYYLVIILIGSFLLWLPISKNNGGFNLPFLDSMFTATSAISVTGLSVVNTADTFNMFGQSVILVLIVCGGMGVMAIKATLYIFLGLKLSNKDRQLVMAEQNKLSMKKIAVHVKNIMAIAIAIQTIGFILLALRFYFYYDMPFNESLWNGFFHSISTINNAGFDLFPNSFVQFKHDYIFQIIIMNLIIFGGIGFPVIIEVGNYFKHKASKQTAVFKFSLFARLTVITYFAILLIGFIFILAKEYNTGLVQGDGSVMQKVFMALFQSVTTRNAGFYTADLSKFSSASILLMTVMMFIGASPSSTGGGIRTTTFAIVVLYIRSKIKNKDLVIFKRKIPESTISQSFVTFSISILLLFIGTILINASDNFLTSDALFEMASAFGTTGLTVGITPYLSDLSKIVIISTMFLGQIGISTMLSAFINESKIRDEAVIAYGEENVIIG